MSKNVQSHYNKIAGIYDSVYQNSLYWDYYDRITWLHLKKFLTFTSLDDVRILDVGCGTGKWGLKLAKSGFHVTFSDISEKMLEQARSKYGKMNFTKEADFIRADVADLSVFENNKFDMIVAQGDVLGSCQDTEAAVREFKRILKTKGVIIASLDNKAKALSFYLKQNDIKGLESFIKTGKTFWFSKNKEKNFPIQMYTKDEIKTIFQKNNFKILNIIGKTVLPVKEYENTLKDKDNFLKMIDLEFKLNNKDDYINLANHIEIAAQKED